MWSDKVFKPYQQLPMEHERSQQDQQGFSTMLMLEPGFNFIYTQNRFEKFRHVISNSDFPEPVLVVTVALKGISWYQPAVGEDICFEQGHTTVFRFMCCRGQRYYPAGADVHQLRMNINRSWFENHLGEEYSRLLFAEEEGVKLWSQKATSVSTLRIARKLASLSLSEALNRLELRSLAISLVRTELGLLLKQFSATDELAFFTPKERQRVEEIPSWIESCCHLPLTVTDMARQAGMNEHKLKKGLQVFFKETLNN